MLIAWLASAPARAEPAREVAVALAWRSGDGCLDTAGLYSAVRSRRRPAPPAVRADAILSGRAEARPAGGWQVELVVADRRGAVLGRRSLAVAEAGCEPLRQHVALVVAMLIDSSVVERAVESRAGPPPPVRRQAAPWRGDAAAAIVAEAGRLPGAVPGLGLAVGLRSPGGWRTELGLIGFAGASAGDGAGDTSLRWAAAALTGCAPGLRPDGWQLTACAGLEAGVMFAEGSGFARNQRDREPLVDGLARARLERRLVGPSFVALGLSGRLAVLRPRFGYEDEAGAFQPLYQPSAGAATLEVGLGAHFP